MTDKEFVAMSEFIEGLSGKNGDEVVIYCRVSSGTQANHSNGLQRQLMGCMKYAKEKGYEVLAAFSDVGTDFNDKNKLHGRRRAEQMAAFRKSTLLVESIDRFSRCGCIPKCDIELAFGEIRIPARAEYIPLLKQLSC